MTIPIEKLFDYVTDAMKGKIPAGMSLFGYSGNNDIKGYMDGYLLDTPHGYWGNPGTVPEGHSQALPAAIKDLIGDATHTVDITNMQTPNGELRKAVIAGLKTLADKGKKVSVRILLGKTLGELSSYHPDTEQLLKDIREAIKNSPRCLEVWAGAICWKINSWNHSKIVAIDGKAIITGGHNFWSEVYLNREAPTFDLSLRYDGPIAKGGHDFANGLWNFVRDKPSTPGTYFHYLSPDLTIDKSKAPPTHSVVTTPLPRGIPAMWVTNPGWGVFMKDGNHILESTMTLAFCKALESAKHCCIAQQTFASRVDPLNEIAPYKIVQYKDYADKFIVGRTENGMRCYYLLSVFDALARFVDRAGTNKLEIVVSNPKAGDYGRGEAEGQIFDMLSLRLNQIFGYDKPTSLAKINAQVTLRYPAFVHAGTRYTRWAGSNTLMANHSKFWMLDSKLVYVGSENLYPSTGFTIPPMLDIVNASLHEFGVIAEVDQPVADMISNEYFRLMHDFGDPRPARIEDLRW